MNSKTWKINKKFMNKNKKFVIKILKIDKILNLQLHSAADLN
jgi:hypothetical protein